MENFFGAIWLFDYRERSSGLSPPLGLAIHAAADDDVGQHVAAVSHSFEKLKAAHLRHVDVENQAVALACPGGGEKLPTGREFSCLPAVAFEQKPKRIPRSLIIVYDENHQPSAQTSTISAWFFFDALI